MKRSLKILVPLLIIAAILISSCFACSDEEKIAPAATSTPTVSPITSPATTTTPDEATPTPTSFSSTPTTETNPIPAQGEPLVTLPDLSPVVDKVAPAVVLITSEATVNNFFMQPVPQEGAGTGVIFDSSGYIVTNNHVVEGAETITVSLTDGRIFDVDPKTSVWTDPLSDLAVIKIEGDNLPTAQFADPRDITPYQWVVAIGYPFKLEGDPSITIGIISACGRSIKEPNGVVLYDLIQTSAAINPGNSGGPLLNLAGNIIGINTAIISGAQNVGFSISASTVIPVVTDLISKGYVARPYIGIYMQTLDPSVVQHFGLTVDEGVMITRIVPDSPAERADLRMGDVITAADGEKITNMEELRQVILTHKPGDTMEITFMRGTDTKEASIQLAESLPPE
ncbi:MAG: trypsin-like peptidase domain-containing protein [Dehalococcoidia bacterium]|nr:trypsin-like peptidase domain-containing protein [Dehalococcoidia bacterium]